MTKPKKNTKEKKLFDNLLKVTYEYIKGRRYSPQSKESLIQRLNIHQDHLDIFESVLRDLKESGKVNESSSRFLPTSEQPDLKQAMPQTQQGLQQQIVSTKSTSAKIITGTIKVHPRGFGFVEPEDSSEQDIFIPKPYMLNAIDSDVVEVLVNPDSSSEKGPDGKVLKVLSRTRNQLVCTVFSTRQDTVLAHSMLLGAAHRIIVEPNSSTPLEIGDRILVHVDEWGSKNESTYTTLSKKIGHITDPETDIPAAILEHSIRTQFPKEAVSEALSFGTRVTKEDLVGRTDLRDLECFTIDPDTAKDFDDALSVSFANGIYTLGIHIADVSHYVKEGSALDIEASRRSNSTYFPGKCIPMLPSELSDNLCSLREGVLRLTVSVFVKVDMQGNTLSWDIQRSVIKSRKRFTYKQAKKILDGTLKSPHLPTLQRLVEVCELFKAQRAERGSVQLYMPELVIKVDEKGVPTGTEVVDYDITHQLVEECMLKANQIVALHLTKIGKNVTFRVHEEPAKESLEEFAALASAFGHHISPTPTPQEIQLFFASLDESRTSQYLATCYIRSMRLACYSPDNIGHYGLSLEHYCHFTSPIRRYVDTIVHRILFEENIDHDRLVKICNKASECERISAKAEGSVLFMKKLRLLQSTWQGSQFRQFEAVVTRIKPFGIYFDVLEFMLEGFLHISELDDDYFDFDEKTMQLSGRHAGFSYKAGDKLHVFVRHIDLIKQECSWNLAAHETSESDTTIGAPLPKAQNKHRAKKHNRKGPSKGSSKGPPKDLPKRRRKAPAQKAASHGTKKKSTKLTKPKDRGQKKQREKS